MMWLLLFALTALVAVLPMLPALHEWRRPSDVVPLHIDTADALDPPFMARSFLQRLQTAVAARSGVLGSSALAAAPAGGPWPLDAAEMAARRSQRVWHAAGDAQLPGGIDFLGEVAAAQSLQVPGYQTARALHAGRRLALGPGTTVLRWAHGATVDAEAGCRLHGRVSADEQLVLQPDVHFTLLHAPLIRFAGEAGSEPPVPAAAAPGAMFHLGLPEGVEWDAAVGRGVANRPLDIGTARTWRGDLVCRGDLRIGEGCHAHGSIKALGDVVLGAGSTVTGSLIATGRIVMEAGASVRGAVAAEAGIELGARCHVGAPGQPATVTAPSVIVGPGTVVHGTVWAVDGGHSPAAQASAGAAAPHDHVEPVGARGAAA